ncbi:MAG: murein biosynthesis integral membrane protein MurJ [Deltaproteobacteria bacterium]|nr:murein biosynthesis integral membrane protein MurJ [Deltaproteobacteria bacterium]
METAGQKENKTIVKAAGTVGFATLISRAFGYVRDMVIAFFFGAGWVTDAFFVAFRIPNMLRRLVAEGSLTVSFIPVFTDYLSNKSKKEALELANIVFCLLSILLVFIVVVGIVFSPIIVRLIAPGFGDYPAQFALTVFLNRLMFPYILFVSLVALAMGILNSFKHFYAPAMSPILLNISIILAAYLLRDLFTEPIIALAIGVLVGGVLQLAMQFPYLIKFGFRPRLDFNIKHPGIRRILMLMLPTTLGAAVYQINVFIGTLLASFLPKGSVSYLYYSDRIVEMPLGVFGIALGTAILPSLSRQVAQGRIDEMQKTLSFSLNTLFFLTIPAMVGLILLREPIVAVLFGRGEFSPLAVTKTADALLCYSLGLWAFASVRIVSSGFFALSDAQTPMKAAIIAMVFNVVFSLILMIPLQHVGIALATSIASAINVLFLGVVLWRRIGAFLDKAFFLSQGKILFSSLVMVAVLLLFEWLAPFALRTGEANRIGWLVAAFVLGGGAYFTASFLSGANEVRYLLSRLTGNRIKR